MLPNASGMKAISCFGENLTCTLSCHGQQQMAKTCNYYGIIKWDSSATSSWDIITQGEVEMGLGDQYRV